MVQVDFGWVLALPRGVGSTSAACGARSDQYVVAHTQREAKRCTQEYGQQAVALDSAREFLLGRRAPVVFDLAAVQEIITRYENRIQEILERRSEWYK